MRCTSNVPHLDIGKPHLRNKKWQPWLHMPEYEINNLLTQIHDKSLPLTLSFGIGIHRAGLKDRDRHIVEELFVNQRIQILVATVNIQLKIIFILLNFLF
jgi:hypothetical protein